MIAYAAYCLRRVYYGSTHARHSSESLTPGNMEFPCRAITSHYIVPIQVHTLHVAKHATTSNTLSIACKSVFILNVRPGLMFSHPVQTGRLKLRLFCILTRFRLSLDWPKSGFNASFYNSISLENTQIHRYA